MTRATGALVITLSLMSPALHAEDSVSPPPAPPVSGIRASIEKISFGRSPAAPHVAVPQVRFQQQKPASLATKITAGFAGGLAGFYGGGLLGAALEPNCYCDDPGLRGFMIGAPIGAILGAIWAVKLVDR